jgi:CHAD domain-containing protein
MIFDFESGFKKAKDRIAFGRPYCYENWDKMLSAEIGQMPKKYKAILSKLMERTDEAAELYACSQVAEIKAENEKLMEFVSKIVEADEKQTYFNIVKHAKQFLNP